MACEICEMPALATLLSRAVNAADAIHVAPLKAIADFLHGTAVEGPHVSHPPSDGQLASQLLAGDAERAVALLAPPSSSSSRLRLRLRSIAPRIRVAPVAVHASTSCVKEALFTSQLTSRTESSRSDCARPMPDRTATPKLELKATWSTESQWGGIVWGAP